MPKSRRPEGYYIWINMISRCENSRVPYYKDYGGRGVKVCTRWRASFHLFIGDMGPRPSLQHQIDRIDNNGDYEPDNCRWATHAEQMRNRRNNRRITFQGQTRLLGEWAELFGLKYATLRRRLAQGLTIETALSGRVLTPAETARNAANTRWHGEQQ